MISCVNRARCSVAAGLNAKRCQICGYSWPDRRMASMASAYGLGWGFASTSGRNIGSIVLPRILVFQKSLIQSKLPGGINMKYALAFAASILLTAAETGSPVTYIGHDKVAALFADK